MNFMPTIKVISDYKKGGESMNFSYIKLNAKKNLVRNYFKSFVLSALPYVSIFTLSGLNYYF